MQYFNRGGCRQSTTQNVYRLIHEQRTVINGVEIVIRNLERTNRNGGFKMAALE